MAKLQDTLPNAKVDERRFRANIVIDTNQPISDDDLVGKIIRIGGVELKVIQKTERCRMITIEQSNLGNQPKILKTVYKDYALSFGVYATVVNTGVTSLEDTLLIE